MKAAGKNFILIFGGTLALGVILHFLYGWLPNPLTALFSPVRESLWEHVKIVFWPLLLAGAAVTRRGGRGAGGAWQLSALTASMLMLAVAYVYHILLGGEWMVFDLALYALSVGGGFLLPRLFRPAAERLWVRLAAGALCWILAALLVWFTWSPPDTPLFADLSGGAGAFLTIPV